MFGISVNADDSLRSIVEKALIGEAYGLDYVWVSDSPTQLYAPIVAAAVAASTRRIRVGLGLMSPLLHNAQHIANSMLTLCVTYGNRFDVCIGAGDRQQLTRAGIDIDHTEGLPSKVVEARRIIASNLKTARIRTRIWLGAQGPRMLRIARNFDGILLNYSNIRMIRWAIRQGNLQADSKLRIGISAPSYVYSTPQPDILELAKVASGTIALGTSGSVLRTMGLVDEVRRLRELAQGRPSLEEISSQVPAEIVDNFAIVENVEELPSYIRELKRAGVTHAVFGYPQTRSQDTVRELAKTLRYAS